MLNGPPGVGKSTLAQRYLADHPGALNLDVDRLRRFLGRWRADPVGSASLVRTFGVTAARTHLIAGHDVVVPHYLGRVEHVQEWESLADDIGVEYREFVLLESKDRILARFAARTAAAVDPVHLDAQQLLDAAGGTPQLEAMYDRLLLLMANRPHAQLLAAPEGDPDATYAGLLDRLAAG